MNRYFCARFALPKVLLVLTSAAFLHGQSSPGVFPLASGNQWVLRSAYVSTPVTLQVQSDQMMGNKRRVQLLFSNQWSSFSYLLNPTATSMSLEGVVFNGAVSHFDSAVPWFGSSGSSWASPFGQVTLVSTTATVTAPKQTYQNCWHYQLGTGSSAQDWFLAPNVGFVQFGTGIAAFFLDTATLNTYVAAKPQAVASQCAKIGIDPNPAANTSFSNAAQTATIQQASTAGARLIHVDATWASLEPSPKVYSFSAIQSWLSMARPGGFSIALTIRTVDSNQLSLPSDLQGKAMNDPAVLARFSALLTALAPVLNSSVKWVNLANEVDIYFSQNMSSLGAFEQLFATGYSTLKAVKPAVSIGMVFSYSAYWYNNTVFTVLSPSTDHVAFTYYPIHSDFSVENPSVGVSDLAEIAAAAASKPLIFTEIGYPSSSVIGSSPALQQTFYTNVFNALQSLGSRVAAASFYQMSDMPAATVSSLVQYYSTGSGASFGAFLGTLGVHDQTGAAKLAWSTFSTRATSMLGSTCTTEWPLVLP